MNNNRFRVVMLCGDRISSIIMYNALKSQYDIQCVILEKRPSRIHIISRRIKNLGLLKVIGQLIFIIFNKLLLILSQKKIRSLMNMYKLSDTYYSKDILYNVENINGEIVSTLLKKIKPNAVVINGTRIISRNILSSINVHFLNTHMGITPKYRGVNGGYWALANQDHKNCGVTVHLVDKGVDTGGILYQDTINPSHLDNFNTYQIHQIKKAIPLMKTALNDIKNNKVIVKNSTYPSILWYHPTIIEYFNNFICKGVK